MFSIPFLVQFVMARTFIDEGGNHHDGKQPSSLLIFQQQQRDHRIIVSMPQSEPDLPEDRVEATFALLTAARKLESISDYWLATEKYVHAHKLLTFLAEEKNADLETLPQNEQEATQQIANLYASQADEYRRQSRKCLIKAMEKEHSNPNSDELNDDQARARNRSFAALFSKPIAEPKASAPQESPEPPQPGDLESRLRALNQSLPSGFKSVSERMSDVNKGLGKLGVSSVYTQSNANRFEDEIEKDEDEQIEEILAQAQDEVMMDKMEKENASGEDGAAIAIVKKSMDDDDDDGSTIGHSESEHSEGDELLDNDQMGMKVIHKKVAKAQAKLAELAAMVQEARAKRAKEDADEEEEIYNAHNGDESDDEDSFREVQKNDVAFLMMTGKKKLRSAQRDLKKALAEWDDLIL